MSRPYRKPAPSAVRLANKRPLAGGLLEPIPDTPYSSVENPADPSIFSGPYVYSWAESLIGTDRNKTIIRHIKVNRHIREGFLNGYSCEHLGCIFLNSSYFVTLHSFEDFISTTKKLINTGIWYHVNA